MKLTKNINSNTELPAYIEVDANLDAPKIEYQGKTYVGKEYFDANPELFTEESYQVEHFQMPVEPVEEEKTIEQIQSEIAQLHTQKYVQLLESLNYVDAWEVNAYAQNIGSAYHDEAVALLAWYCDTWETLENTEVILETDPQALIDLLPAL